jgi:hypothetical protein
MLLEADLQSGAARRSVGALVLSRALCRYRHWRAPGGLSPTQAGRAARTFAQAHAPFADTGLLLHRTPAGVGIWWWDAARIRAAFEGTAPREVVPESLLRGATEGWRVLVCAEGVEGQYWEDGALLASSWRRELFTREQWAAFVLGIENPLHPAPSSPPEAMEVRLNRRAGWRSRRLKDPPTWADAQNGLSTAAMCAAAVAMFFFGQAVHGDMRAQADLRRMAALETRIAAEPAVQRVHEQIALLRSYNAALGEGDVLAAAVDAVAALSQLGQEPQSWRVDRSELRIRVLGAATDMPLRDIVAALEASESLCNVEPSFEDSAVEFVAAMGAACGGGP